MSELSRWRSSTCLSGAGVGSPCSSRGWFPGEPWPETSSLRWTEESPASCSRFPQTATAPSLHPHRKCYSSIEFIWIQCFKKCDWKKKMKQKDSVSWPCLAESTPVKALLFGLPLILEFFLLSNALWRQVSVFYQTVLVKKEEKQNTALSSTLYFIRFALRRLTSSWNWLILSCKYLKEILHIN